MLPPAAYLIGVLSFCATGQALPGGQAAESECRPMLLSLAALLEGNPPLPLTQESSPTWSDWLHDHRFFIEVGATNSYPYLHEGHHLANRYLDRSFGWMPGFSSPREYYDLRRAAGLWSIFGAIGYSANDWLDLTFEAGGWGGDTTHRSSPLFVTDLGTRWQYSSIYGQAGMRVYPFCRPAPSHDAIWANLFKQTRPFLYHSLGVTHNSSVNTATLSPRGLPELINVRISMSDWSTTYKLGGGLEMPVSRRLSLMLVGYYNFFFQKQDEFNGFALSMGLRLRL